MKIKTNRTPLDGPTSTLYHFEGNLKECHNEDGESVGTFPAILIMLDLHDMKTDPPSMSSYLLKSFMARGFSAVHQAEELIEKIERKGSVNLEKWDAIPEQSFESQYLENMALAEREERFAEGY